ncbi:Two component regulator propeller [Alteromonadaceae bacterium Bs31]|nr:Two component regulator propeller [Alteromonadaceae bacterium Bs31]
MNRLRSQTLKKILQAVLLLLLCSTGSWSFALSDSQAANLSFEHILPGELEKIGYINDIAQDATGFMWFGGDNGLARYDGYQLRIYRFDEGNSRSLSHNYVNALLLDSDGTFWVATQEGLNKYHPESDDFSLIRQPNSTVASNSEDVRALLEDSKSNLWLGTLDGLFQYNRQEQSFVRYQLLSNPGQAINRAVWTIAEDQDGAIWVGGMEGISRFNSTDGSFQHFFNDLVRDGNTYRDVRHVFCDKQNQIWIAAYGGGIFLYDRLSGNFTPYQHNAENHEKSRMVWDIHQDSEGNMWIGDGLAISLVSAKSQQIYRYSYNSKDSSAPGNYAINRIFEDRTGDIWLGYFPSGVDMVDQQAAVFQNYLHDPDDPNSITDGGIISSLEDNKGNIWVGTGYGLNYFDRKNDSIQRITHSPDQAGGLSGETVLSLAPDGEKGLWIGIWSGGLNRYDFSSGTFKHYRQTRAANSLLGMEPWSLMLDSEQQLWIATEAGVNRYRPETDDFERYLPSPNQLDGDRSLYSRVLLEDSHGGVWVGSNRGLFHLEPTTRTFTRHKHSTDQSSSLSHNFVISLYQDAQGIIWVGTHGGGLNRFDPNSGEFKTYSTKDGLADNVVTGITGDKKGNLWLSSQQGISKFKPQTESFQNYSQQNGLSGNLFNRNTPLRTYDNKLFFGNTRGFVLFDPEALKPNAQLPPVLITNFRIFNKNVSIHDELSPLTQSIETSDSIELNNQQNMLSFQFAALNFRSPEQNQYSYWLEGFDSDWLQGSRTATYTNLPSGNYTLHVKAANNDGLWSTEETRLAIRLLPAWWHSKLAYTVYLTIALLLLLLLARFCFKRSRNNYAPHAQQSIVELDKVKEEFLNNVTHELCSPINGMVGISEALHTHDESFDKETVQQLEAIRSSGKRLSAQIKDIMEYSRLSVEEDPLYLQSVDLHALTEQLIPLFAPLLRSKPIRLINALSANMPRVYADEDRLQQIFINLLSNAIKYTNEGFITVSAEVHKNRIKVSVEDSGVGISTDKLAMVFLPFQRIDTGDDTLFGTGLGLALCKKLVELHGGEITIKSIEQSGTDVHFDLPIYLNEANTNKKKTHESNAKKHREFIRRQLEDTNIIPASLAPSFDKSLGYKENDAICMIANASDFTILLVDDDRVNRMVVATMLKSAKFKVIEEESGEGALSVLENNPSIDLVLLDVIMAQLDGYATCQELRKRFSIKQLPVIFLSANAREKDLNAGYTAGGSDFLIKPVSKLELLAKITVHLQLIA